VPPDYARDFVNAIAKSRRVRVGGRPSDQEAGSFLTRSQRGWHRKILAACEAGESIKPRVKRGFASDTLGPIVNKAQAREAGRQLIQFTHSVARFAGLQHLIALDPRVSLAKPRFTLGYMLSPASQVVSPYPQKPCQENKNLAVCYTVWRYKWELLRLRTKEVGGSDTTDLTMCYQ